MNLRQCECPHCGKPLVVTAEVYGGWKVVVRDTEVVMEPDEVNEFHGGTCETCDTWVERGAVE